MIEQAIAYARQNAPAFLEDLKAIVRIPSISTLPENRADMQRAAKWLADQLRRLGFDRVSIMPTAKHPVVFGEWLKAGKDKPTLLYYGHYDVQPPDPIKLWKTAPFEPTVVGENLFARGIGHEGSTGGVPQGARVAGTQRRLPGQSESDAGG